MIRSIFSRDKNLTLGRDLVENSVAIDVNEDATLSACDNLVFPLL